jgi:ABC-type dipeptide/oligopeptide/nickel transport system permease component
MTPKAQFRCAQHLPLFAVGALAILLLVGGVPAAEASILGVPQTGWFESQARPLRPGLPPRAPLFPRKEPTTSGRTTTVRYSQSAWAGNMVLPAIWLGLPTIVILALIIRSMKGD